jgi:dimethylamine/trimethylamine dehydrogenase
MRKRGNLNMYNHSRLTTAQVLEFAVPNVFIATGASWRRDGVGRSRRTAIDNDQSMAIYTPDDVMAGVLPDPQQMPSLVLFDDELAYMGGLVAQQLADAGYGITLVTSGSVVSPFTDVTLEQATIQRRLLEAGVAIIANHSVQAIEAGEVCIACNYTGQVQRMASNGLLLVTEKQRHSQLYDELMALPDHGLQHLELIGDAQNPGLIADAVYSGHMAARNFEEPAAEVEQQIFHREIIALT